jgi:hypothetical protein
VSKTKVVAGKAKERHCLITSMADNNIPGTFSSSYPSGTDYPGVIAQSPKIDSAGEPTQRAIRDAGMARDVVKLIIQAGRNRSIVGSRIMAKFNAERPYDSYRLEAEGLGWKQNFSTKPLPSLIEKVYPRFSLAVESVKYLTDATLSNKWQNNVEKSEKFQRIITNTIRSRKGWRALVDNISLNNALFGHAVAGCLDEFTWFPTFFRFDEAFFPDGTKSEVRFCQVAVLKEVAYPHEVFAKIKDRKEAEMAGYDLAKTIANINIASPVQIRDRLNVGGTLEFWYQQALRELVIGASYMAGANVIVIYHLLVKEVTGKVSHYQLAGPNMDLIFSKDDRFPSFEDCLTIFTYQLGIGTVHGSKGIGRDLYELAGMIDRTRNEIVDRSILSGKIPVQGDTKRIHTFKMSVVGMTCIFPTGWNILEQRLDGNVESQLKLDAYFRSLADELIGNVSPPQVAGSGDALRSPAAWNVLTSREEEGKDARINRFLEQFVPMVQMMQKRICDKETTEEDAKEAQRELLKIMSREEIDELANHVVAETVKDLTPLERQMIVQFANEKKGNPLYNQRALEVEDGTARVGADFVDRVLLPDNDPSQEAEQHRQQQLETNLLMQGQAVPVSPRDAHMIHLQTIMPLAEQAGAAMMQGQADTQTFEAIVAHIAEHANRAQEQSVPKEQLKPILDFLAQAGPAIAKLKQLDAQAQQLSAASQQHDQESQMIAAGQPPPPNVVPMQ